MPFLPQETKEAMRGGIETGEELKETILKPKTTMEKIGKTAEQIGEFMIPVGQLKAISFLKKVPMISKALRGAIEFGGKTAIQTGGEKKAIGISALLGATAPVVGAVAGKVKKFVTQVMPQRIYSIIFKTAESDLRAAYKTISKGEQLNPTLAKEVLEKGIKGSSENMAVMSFQKVAQIEKNMLNAIKAKSTTFIPLSQATKKELTNFLTITNKSYKDIANVQKELTKMGYKYEPISSQAQSLLRELQSSPKNKLGLSLTLRLKRFLDGVRSTSSFRADKILSEKQEKFKLAADLLRIKFKNVSPEFAKAMSEERIYIQALDSIIKDAAKRANRNILGLFDLIAGGGGMASGNIMGGVTVALAVRGFQQPLTLTNLAQALYKLRQTPGLESLIKAVPPLLIKEKQ